MSRIAIHDLEVPPAIRRRAQWRRLLRKAGWALVAVSGLLLGATAIASYHTNQNGLQAPARTIATDLRETEDAATAVSLAASARLQAGWLIDSLNEVAQGDGPAAADARKYLKQLGDRISAQK